MLLFIKLLSGEPTEDLQLNINKQSAVLKKKYRFILNTLTQL